MERRSQEWCCQAVQSCPIHFPAQQFCRPSALSRQSLGNVPGAPSTVRALCRNPQFLRTTSALALPSFARIPRAIAQSCPLRGALVRSPCTRTSPSHRSITPPLFPSAPFLCSSLREIVLLLKRLSSPDATQICATAIPVSPATHPQASIPRVAALQAPSISLPDHQTPAKTELASL